MRFLKHLAITLLIVGTLGALPGVIYQSFDVVALGFGAGLVYASTGVFTGLVVRLVFRCFGCRQNWLTSAIAAILGPIIFVAFLHNWGSSSTSDGNALVYFPILFTGVPVVLVTSWIFGFGFWENQPVDDEYQNFE